MPPPVDTKATALSGYDGRHDKQLMVGDIVLNAHYGGGSDCKTWFVQMLEAPAEPSK